jgi:hypothetical protein
MASVEIVVMRLRSGGPRGTSGTPIYVRRMPSKNTAWLRAREAAACPRVPHALPRQHATLRAASRTSPCRFRAPRGGGCRRFYPFQMVEAGTEVPAPPLPVGHGVSPAEWRRVSACGAGLQPCRMAAHVRIWGRASALPMGGRPACERYKPDHRRPRLPRIFETPCSCGVAYDIRCRATVQTFFGGGRWAGPRDPQALSPARRVPLSGAPMFIRHRSSLNCRRHR